MARVAIAVALITGVVGVGALLWIGGEEHYRGCVETAVAKYPPLFDPGSAGRDTGFGTVGGAPPNSRAARRAVSAIDDCSRLPF